MFTPNNTLKLAAVLSMAAVVLQVPAFAGDADKSTETTVKKSHHFGSKAKKQVATVGSDSAKDDKAASTGSIPSSSPSEFVLGSF